MQVEKRERTIRIRKSIIFSQFVLYRNTKWSHVYGTMHIFWQSIHSFSKWILVFFPSWMWRITVYVCVCERGSTDDLGANRGHWGPNPQVWEQAVVKVAHTCLSFYLPRYHTEPGKLRKMKTSWLLCHLRRVIWGKAASCNQSSALCETVDTAAAVWTIISESVMSNQGLIGTLGRNGL